MITDKDVQNEVSERELSAFDEELLDLDSMKKKSNAAASLKTGEYVNHRLAAEKLELENRKAADARIKAVEESTFKTLQENNKKELAKLQHSLDQQKLELDKQLQEMRLKFESEKDSRQYDLESRKLDIEEKKLQLDAEVAKAKAEAEKKGAIAQTTTALLSCVGKLATAGAALAAVVFACDKDTEQVFSKQLSTVASNVTSILKL